MELHRNPYRPVADGLAPSKVPEASPNSGPNGRSQAQPDSDKDLDEVLLLDQVSHRRHVTDTQVEDLDPQEHSLVNAISAPFRSPSQQRHFKAIFTRPVSANGEIQTGFTFGKAPSPKALCLTGGRGPATTSPQNIGECIMLGSITSPYQQLSSISSNFPVELERQPSPAP